MNANSGYSGWSMSNRAVAAYEAGEKPKSRWTKKAMLAEIRAYAYGEDISQEAMAYLEGLTKDELFRRFFNITSWHHTSKFFNATNFYALDEGAVDSFIECPTKRTYRIVCGLKEHHVKLKQTYDTDAKAMGALRKKGFKPTGCGTFYKGAFRAYVIVEESKLAVGEA